MRSFLAHVGVTISPIDPRAESDSMSVSSFVALDAKMVTIPGSDKAVFVGPIKVVGSPAKEFFHLQKTNYSITKLLLSQAPGTPKMCQTDLIERITELRDEKFRGLLREKGVVVNKRLRYSNNKVHSVILTLPLYVDICVAGQGDIGDHTVTVLNTKPTSELWVEFSVENITFFCNMIKIQVEAGTILRKHVRNVVPVQEDTGVVGVTWSYANNRYRVQLKEDGKSRTKVVKCSAKRSKADALERAKRIREFGDVQCHSEDDDTDGENAVGTSDGEEVARTEQHEEC